MIFERTLSIFEVRSNRSKEGGHGELKDSTKKVNKDQIHKYFQNAWSGFFNVFEITRDREPLVQL